MPLSEEEARLLEQMERALVEDDPAEDRSPTGSALEGRAAPRGGELGVLLDEGALHLLQQAGLFLGQRHGSSSTRVWQV